MLSAWPLLYHERVRWRNDYVSKLSFGRSLFSFDGEANPSSLTWVIRSSRVTPKTSESFILRTFSREEISNGENVHVLLATSLLALLEKKNHSSPKSFLKRTEEMAVIILVFQHLADLFNVRCFRINLPTFKSILQYFLALSSTNIFYSNLKAYIIVKIIVTKICLVVHTFSVNLSKS